MNLDREFIYPQHWFWAKGNAIFFWNPLLGLIPEEDGVTLFEVHSFLQDVEQLPKKISHTEWEKGFVKTLNKYDPLKTKS